MLLNYFYLKIKKYAFFLLAGILFSSTACGGTPVKINQGKNEPEKISMALDLITERGASDEFIDEFRSVLEKVADSHVSAKHLGEFIKQLNNRRGNNDLPPNGGENYQMPPKEGINYQMPSKDEKAYSMKKREYPANNQDSYDESASERLNTKW